MSFKSIFFILLSFIFSHSLQAAILTYDFTGTFKTNSDLFQIGDTFSGSYTFDSSITLSSHPDNTLNYQASVIHPSLPGTSWELDVNSSVTSNFSTSGTHGSIALGNNTPYGDRYIVTLSGTSGSFSDGSSLALLQFDLYDPVGTGMDIIHQEQLSVLPDVAAAHSPGGRFFNTGSPTSAQHSIQLNSLTNAVPEPSTYALLCLSIIGALAVRRKTSRK